MADGIKNVIINMVADQLVTHLTQKLITEIDEDDPTRVSVVKHGRFQEDPSTRPLRISVQGGNFEDPKYWDALVVRNQGDDMRMGFYVPVREIGGTEMWWRRGSIHFELFFLLKEAGITEDVARDRAYTIQSRTHSALDTCNVGGMTDDFGETAIKIFTASSHLFMGGGPPSNYLWRGTIHWSVLTARE